MFTINVLCQHTRQSCRAFASENNDLRDPGRLCRSFIDHIPGWVGRGVDRGKTHQSSGRYNAVRLCQGTVSTPTADKRNVGAFSIINKNRCVVICFFFFLRVVNIVIGGIRSGVTIRAGKKNKYDIRAEKRRSAVRKTVGWYCLTNAEKKTDKKTKKKQKIRNTRTRQMILRACVRVWLWSGADEMFFQ